MAEDRRSPEDLSDLADNPEEGIVTLTAPKDWNPRLSQKKIDEYNKNRKENDDINAPTFVLGRGGNPSYLKRVINYLRRLVS